MSEETCLTISRRDALRGLTLLGCTGIASLTIGGSPRVAFGQSVGGDIGILLAALYLEQEAIAAYQAGAESGLLPDALLKAAVAFQADHKHHRDGIIGAIKTLGGTPIEPQNKYSFGRLKSDKDILKLARNLEQGAIDAYANLASSIQNRTVLDFAAHVLADEVRHVTVLKSVLGIPNY